MFSFYVFSGFDIVAHLKRWNMDNEKLVKALKSTAGNAAVAYLLYKVASPVRYAMTLGGTHVTVQLLRRLGYLRTPPAIKQVAK